MDLSQNKNQTIEYIRRKFEEFNELCFEGKLPLIPIKLSKAHTFLGKINFSKRRNPDGTWHYYDFSFRINTKIELPEQVIEDTIIHEMIHYWILFNQMQDSSPHGHIFKAKMREINMTHNRNIVVSQKVSNAQRSKDTEIRRHLVCVSWMSNGEIGVTVVPQTRIFKLWDEMAKLQNVVKQKWLVTIDPYFNRYPRSMTPKAYSIPPEDLEAILRSSAELIRMGNKIFAK